MKDAPAVHEQYRRNTCMTKTASAFIILLGIQRQKFTRNWQVPVVPSALGDGCGGQPQG